MSTVYSNHVNPRTKQRSCPQTEVIPGRENDMVVNSAGGYVFQVNDWDYLDRFLILGSEGGTYYVTEQKLTQDDAKHVQHLIDQDGIRVVDRVVEVSQAGRAPKNDPALFVLAMCCAAKDEKVRKAAIVALPKVARIGTHLFHFAEFVQAFRGWGRALRRGVADWYNNKNLDDLVYQVVKYKSRDGWANRDLLRLSHPKTTDEIRNELYKWMTSPDKVTLSADHGPLGRLKAAEQLARETDVKAAIKLISDFNLPREVVNTQLLNDPEIWEALLEKMPMTAMIRNLGKMTNVGLLKDNSSAALKIMQTLEDRDNLKKARVHPLSVLVALETYKMGRGQKGSLVWTPVQSLVESLERAFYESFDTVTPTGKRWLLGIDVSGSMTWGEIAGMTGISPNIAAATMAMVTARVEKQKKIMGFADSFRELGVSSNDSLNTVIKKTQSMSFGSTDCALPMQYATKNKLDVDAFVVYTDNETYIGKQHPAQALREYRQKTGIPAKLIVVGMASTGFTIADPNDSCILDVVGFDSSAPEIMSQFVSN